VSLFITVPQFFSNKMGITRTVKKPKNNYIIISYMKINRVWKPFKKTTPHSMINIWITQWIQANFIYRSIKHLKKIISKPWCLIFIPFIASDEIFLYFRKKTYCISHFLFSMLLFISSRDKRLSGSASYFFNLLSSSSL